MVYEATRDLPICDVEVETPLTKTVGRKIAGRKLAFVPILRAGLGMVDSVWYMVIAFLPSAVPSYDALYSA